MTPSEILISVIIPTYNYGAVVGRALDSVLAQWEEDVELLVINDGSRDNTADVLDDYASRYPGKLQVIHQDNAGPAAARNNGIRLASGRYVLLLDADDELLPDALQCLRQALQETPEAELVLGGQVSVYPDGRQRVRLPDPVTGSPLQRARRYLLEKRIAIAHGSSLFRRELLLQRPYPENLRGGEDVAVFAFVLVNARVALVNKPLARIYKHSDSLRHVRHDDAGYVARMTHEVFAGLPEACQSLRTRYEAQRYLSLFRAALLAGDRAVARSCYLQAAKISLRQALRWDYLRKAVWTFLQVR
ncbi:MAG: glycosyltransferase [Desulfuromonadales bacterium]|nr:glycosyltransferase [Desulfuromonadales bacterium]